MFYLILHQMGDAYTRIACAILKTVRARLPYKFTAVFMSHITDTEVPALMAYAGVDTRSSGLRDTLRLTYG